MLAAPKWLGRYAKSLYLRIKSWTTYSGNLTVFEDTMLKLYESTEAIELVLKLLYMLVAVRQAVEF